MRLVADVLANEQIVKRLLIHETETGVYLFGFNRMSAGGTMWDEWYETVAEAQAVGQETYQISLKAWTQINDPCENCQQDWIQPVRVKGRNLGQPEWGKLERLIDGQWLAFDPEE